MCVNCNDNINAVVVYSGPAGPQGIAGLNASMTAASVTSNTIASSGSKTFALTPNLLNLGWAVGQRLRVSNFSNVSNWMEGLISSVSSSSVTITPDSQGTGGTFSNWTISIAGSQGVQGVQGTQGPNGPQGVSSYTVMASATNVGTNLWELQVQTTLWMVVGQVLFIETCGYFKVTVIANLNTVTVQDLLYAGNTPANFSPVIGTPGVGPGGLAGASVAPSVAFNSVLKDLASPTPVTIIGTNTGSYIEIGKLVHVEIYVTFVGITVFGTGGYTLTLPTSKDPARVNRYLCGTIFNGSTNTHYQLKAGLSSGTNTFTLYNISQSALTDVNFTQTIPFTVDAGTKLYLSFTYEQV